MSVVQKLASRRNVLQGMLGGGVVTLGLPFLDAFLNNNGTALAATGKALPTVFGTWFWGLGLSPGRWEPTTVGKYADLGPETKVLLPFKDKLNFYSGTKVFLDGRPLITHYTGNFSVLTGTTPREQRVTIPTLDAIIADHIGAKTRFRSLEMTSTGNPVHSYSTRAGTVINPAEASPKALYARVFGPEFVDPNAANFTPDPMVLARQSMLSVVKDQRDDLMKVLGASDKQRLDEYFTSLRQIENQLQIESEKPAPMEACTPARSVEDAPLGTDIEMVDANHKLFGQILAHTLACGQTRVFNMTYADATSSLRHKGSQMVHHAYTHEEATDPVLGYQKTVVSFQLTIMNGLANMVKTLDSMREGDGTLLDRTLMLASTDTGLAKVHSLENFPLITAGKAGGRLKTGLHIRTAGDPATRVGLTLQQAMGLPINSWGTDSMATNKSITEVLA